MIPSAKTFSSNEYLDSDLSGIQESNLDVFLIENRLRSFANLGFNWDGYHGVPPTRSVVNAIQFYRFLPRILQERILTDHISPTPYGTITLEWANGDFFISIEIGENKIGFFSELPDGTSPKLESKEFNENHIPNELVDAFEVLYKVRKNS